ncbi:MAG: glycosyltransferase family 39 protein [Candidatus Moraniibacteriota bacterium]
MMQRVKEYFQKNERIIFLFALILVVVTGVFLRTYHHHDWLRFQLDQARDATIISNAVRNGIDQLPLLGPQARGSGLKLGPIFYYFQYVAAKLFGDRPNVMAWPDLVFSILSLPLFYIFVRKYFSKWLSLGLLAVFSTSLFVIFYARFAWNPNSMAFFLLLMSLSLLNAAEQDNQNAPRWLSAAFFSSAVATQLHFVAFFLAPVVFTAFLVLTRPNIRLRHYLVGVLIVAAVYSPVIRSEFQSSGQNSAAFEEAFVQKTEENNADHTLAEKTFRAVQETSRNTLAIITGVQDTDIIATKTKGRGLKVTCDANCKTYLPGLIFSLIAFMAGFAILLYQGGIRYFQGTKNAFLAMNLIWLVAFMALLVPIAYQISPRFFLAGEIPMIIMLGIAIQAFSNRFPSEKATWITIVIFLAICGLNVTAVSRYFTLEEGVRANKDAPSAYGRDIIMPGGETVVLRQLEDIAKLIDEDAKRNGIKTVFIAADNYFARSIFYILKYQLGTPADCYFKMSDFPPTFGKTTYYVVRSDLDHLNAEILRNNEVSSRTEQGTLTVYKLKPNVMVPDNIPASHYCNPF